ncbi:hypothetical protein SDC9_09393 [bioreactor metagenome]|uniref:Uncharacterized protein n=1 Tax=bioreactor metagenome TaxID=1076179 RepID=A0A644TC54_9ZZZZ|nr:hypothetical protein [Desulfitobacterium hafniense]MEA5024282.1 hypothetical protein [Desulfitobacterium hafniense]
MNYHEFMEAVDKKLALMSEAEKSGWIHNMARTRSEHERAAFLNSLMGKQEHFPVISEREWIEAWCRKIDNQEIYFECSYEEYGGDYWGSDDVYEYTDIFEIGKDLLRAFKIAEGLLFQKDYSRAAALYDRLCRLSFPTLEDETEEWSELNLEELVSEGLVSLNLKQIALNLLYARYQAAEGRERSAALYTYLAWDMCKNISIEELFTAGPEELKGLDVFMEEWLDFLKDIPGDRAGDLLIEACLCRGGIVRLCDVAKEVCTRHPILYKYACDYLLNGNKALECERVGLEALGMLPEQLIVRGKIAAITAKAAEQLEHPDILRQCWEAAFYSEPTLNHYLQLFELPDHRNIADRAANYAKTLPERPSTAEGYNNRQMLVNHLSREHKAVIRFFNREFAAIYEECKKNKTALGWSSDFKGLAVPLFVLLLSKNKEITKAGEKLINGIDYRLGFEEEEGADFRELFLRWKEKAILTDEEYERYIEWLKKEVDIRTEAVVGGGHRKSYYKAAALVAFLGETLESNGMANGRRILIEHYTKMHPRKRAFKGEFEMLK